MSYSLGYDIRIGITLPFDNAQLKAFSSYETSAGAVTLALDRVKREQLLPRANFRYVISVDLLPL